MKKILIFIIVIGLFSCDNKPRDLGEFKITDTEEDVSKVAYKWEWSSDGHRNVEVVFEIIDFENNVPTIIVTENGDPEEVLAYSTVAYSLFNNTGRISDVYTYKNGRPDFDSTYRAWVITYTGSVEKKVIVNWSGKLKQTEGQGTTFVETLFQIYGNDNWPEYSNNIRPQIEVDTLFLGLNMTELQIRQQRDAARGRMIARFHRNSVNIAPAQPNNNNEEGEEEEEVTVEPLEMNGTGSFVLQPDVTYRMQLFTRIYNNDRDHTAKYEITDGTLTIGFE